MGWGIYFFVKNLIINEIISRRITRMIEPITMIARCARIGTPCVVSMMGSKRILGY
jgi:hypothetical protein